MRDGIELTADLYYPTGSEICNDYPCILIRLPGGRKAEPWVQLSNLANEGYVIAIQDTRSALDKEGKTLPFFSDGWENQQDGLDTINWLAASSFTNGKIGTMGYSAAGITQVLLAPTAPSALKCQYIGQTPASLYHHAIYNGGRFQKHQVEIWFQYYAPHPSVLELVKQNPLYNDLWRSVDTLPLAHKVVIPGLHYGGWFDPFLQGTIDTFNARQHQGGEGAKGNQKLIIGPWNHYWPMDITLGDFQVPDNARQAPIDMSAETWFAHHLKETQNDVSKMPSVTYYVMGPFDGSASSGNVWRHADSWPIPSKMTSFYLTSDKKLSSKEAGKKGSFHYAYDPENPIPTLGGRNLFLAYGPKNQQPNESRSDVLIFTTSPLEEELEVTGQLQMQLFVESKVSDIDFVVQLTDVYPDGKSLLIADGMTHLEIAKEEHNKPQTLHIDLWATSMVFAKGHSIRIVLSGSNYPRYEKSTQKVAADSGDCRILVGKEFPSCLCLPIANKKN